MEFCLGTAGWRMNYGVFPGVINSPRELKRLADRAFQLGFKSIDTAPGYGDAEEVIGVINPSQRVATKIFYIPGQLEENTRLLESSKRNLAMKSLDIVFIHNWDQLSISDKTEAAVFMKTNVRKGFIESWGVSTYEYLEVKRLIESNDFPPNIQINANVLDQRILRIESLLKQSEIELWIRSVFLQGVLLNNSANNPFIGNRDLEKFFEFCRLNNLTPLQGSISFFQTFDFRFNLVIGINSITQLTEISEVPNFQFPRQRMNHLKSQDLDLVDPRRWT